MHRVSSHGHTAETWLTIAPVPGPRRPLPAPSLGHARRVRSGKFVKELDLYDLEEARDNASFSSMGGFAFLVAYGTTLIIAGLLAFVLPLETAALVIIFQGSVALPAAFALERLLGFPKMTPDNPLRPLSIQMSMVQVVALPAVIIVYALNPVYVPAVFAAIGGGHFLPYAWLHRSRTYIYLGVLISLGSFFMMAIWGATAFAFIPIFMGTVFWLAAFVLRSEVQSRLLSTRG